ncbi:complex I NDUFA9 subunit family protein [Aquaspirillum soli]
MQYKKIALIGGSGFVGTQIAARLASVERELVIPTRRRERRKEALILLTNTQMIETDIFNEQELDHLLAGCDAVINLVGILHGSRDEFEKAHVEVPRRLIAACQRNGIQRLLHMSALGADPHGPSNYQDTKAAGEALIQHSGLDWTIFRPSVVFGADDNFLNMFACLLNTFPVLPLAGASTRFQPVWVQDVARAFVEALSRPATIGQTLELVGPDTYTLKELVQYVGELIERPRLVVGIPTGVAMLQAMVLQMVPGQPLMSFDNVRSLERDNVSESGFPSELLGFAPSKLEAIAPVYLGPLSSQAQLDAYRAGAHR